jgi:HYDIN/CFA65/VesB family protein/centrosomal CEP192-like protein
MKLIKTVFVCVAIAITAGFSLQADAQWLPDVSITPDPLTFPDTRVDEISQDMTITVTNTQGFLPLYIFSAKISDPNIFFIVENGCAGQTLNNHESCELEVNFRPTENGHYSAALSVVGLSSTIINSSTVEGRGVEPLVVLSSSAINFGDQTVGQQGVPREVLMTNSGSSELSITDITASGDFSVTDDCGDSLAASESCSLEIDFEPTQLGATTGAITITDDASSSPQSIDLSGTGVAPGTPDAGLSSHSVEFAPVVAGQTSSATDVTLTSTGTVDLEITDISASANFGVSDNCGNTLTPGSSCTVSITFSPPEAADFSGTVTIESNASDSPQSISLSGIGVSQTGPQTSLSVNALDFGEQVVDTESTARAITVTNSGTESLSISAVALGGDNSTSYNKNDNCHAATVAPGDSCTISVAFTPTADGSLAATVSITDNSASSPQSVSLTGIGIAPTSSSGSCSLSAGSAVAPWSILASLSMAIAGVVGIRRFRRK